MPHTPDRSTKRLLSNDPSKSHERVVLVTGTSSGLGEALCLEFARIPNCIVIATSRKPLPESSPLLAHEQIQTMLLDVTDEDCCKVCFELIKDLYGTLGCLVNNAGFARFGPAAEQPISTEFEQVFQTNVFGLLRVVQHAVPLMRRENGDKSGTGIIINIGSVTSFLTTPWSAAYSGSKAAVLSLSSAMKQELKMFNIDVCFAMAGSIRSEFGNNASQSGVNLYSSNKSLYKDYAKNISDRCHASQRASSTMPAESVAATIVKEYKSRCSKGKRSLWFYCGGSSRLLFIMGLLQKIGLNSLVDSILMKHAGLSG